MVLCFQPVSCRDVWTQAHQKGPCGPDGVSHPPPVDRITCIIRQEQRMSSENSVIAPNPLKGGRVEVTPGASSQRRASVFAQDVEETVERK